MTAPIETSVEVLHDVSPAAHETAGESDGQSPIPPRSVASCANVAGDFGQPSLPSPGDPSPAGEGDDLPSRLPATGDGSALEVLSSRARDYVQAGRATSTRAAYARDWSAWAEWCRQRGAVALPAEPEAIALYVTELAGERHPSTINRRLAAIASVHRDAGIEPPPTAAGPVVRVMRGVRRTVGTAPRRQVTAAVTADVRAMVEHLPPGLIGVRDRALLLVGFAGAFRRSELVALDVEDLAETDDGLVVTVRRSKTDQEGAGRQLGVPYGSQPASCPVRALRTWREASGVDVGAVWRSIDRHGRMGGRLSPAAVALVVKRAAAGAGLDPARYAGHSLRAGLATAAAAAGVSERAIMAQTGHKSLPTVRRYIRGGSLFRDNAAAQVGL